MTILASLLSDYSAFKNASMLYNFLIFHCRHRLKRKKEMRWEERRLTSLLGTTLLHLSACTRSSKVTVNCIWRSLLRSAQPNSIGGVFASTERCLHSAQRMTHAFSSSFVLSCPAFLFCLTSSHLIWGLIYTLVHYLLYSTLNYCVCQYVTLK